MPRVVKWVAQNALLYVTFGLWCFGFVWFGFFFKKLNGSVTLIFMVFELFLVSSRCFRKPVEVQYVLESTECSQKERKKLNHVCCWVK